MYDAHADPYCYPDGALLKNLPGLTSQSALERFEAMATGRRFLEPMPSGRWGALHYRAIHRHIFQDVYAWAGKDRTVRISKGGSTFCYPEHIAAELRRVFRDLKTADLERGVEAHSFATHAAHFLAELNAVHAFRDGNGRAQLAFLALFAAQAGHPLDLDRLEPPAFLDAMIASFHGREASLAAQISGLIA